MIRVCMKMDIVMWTHAYVLAPFCRTSHVNQLQALFFQPPLLPFDLQKLQPNEFCRFATSTQAPSYFLPFFYLGSTQAGSGASCRAINYA